MSRPNLPARGILSLLVPAMGLSAVVVLGTSAPAAPAHGESKQAASAKRTVAGHIIKLTADVCVIKDGSGKSVLFTVGPRTKMEGAVQEGTKVEVSVAPEGVTVLIKAIK